MTATDPIDASRMLRVPARLAAVPDQPGEHADLDPAFRVLYVDQFQPMVRLAALLGARSQAEDTAQEAFVRLHQNWSRLGDTDAAVGWLRATMMNLIRSQARRDDTAARHAARVEPTDRVGLSDLSERSVRSETQHAVMVAIRDLPQRQREAIVLHHYLGLTETQIAVSMGCSVGSVRTHVKRGRASLAAKLGDLR